LGKSISVTVNKIEKGLRNGDDPLSEPDGMDPVSQKDTTISELKGKVYNNNQVFVVAKNGYQYYLSRDNESSRDVENLLIQIVSTFKFIN
jgi:hypothetical protein